MVRIIHIVGPQGSGKSTLANLIVAGALGKGINLDSDDVRGISNDEIRLAHAGMQVVCVEAQALGPRHQDLKQGDTVMVVQGEAALDPQDSFAALVKQREAKHAALQLGAGIDHDAAAIKRVFCEMAARGRWPLMNLTTGATWGELDAQLVGNLLDAFSEIDRQAAARS